MSALPQVAFDVLPQFSLLYSIGYWYKVLWGGRAGGKSVAVAMYLLYVCSNFRTKILCVRGFQNSIEDSSKAEIERCMDLLGVRKDWVVTRSYLKHKRTGSYIMFRGINEHPESVKSIPGIDICWIEEAQTITGDAWRILQDTLREGDVETIVTLNPRFATDPVYKEFFGPQGAPPKTAIMEANYLDNPFCSDKTRAIAAHLQLTDPEAYAYHYMGQLLQTGELQIFKLRDIVAARSRVITYDPGRPVVAALDVARFGNNESVLWWRHGDDCTRYRAWKGLDSRQLMLAVCDELRNHPASHLIIDDPGVGGAGVYDHIGPYLPGVRLHRFLGGGKPKDPTRFSNLRTECYFLASAAIQSTARLPDDSTLTDQATAIGYTYNDKDRKQAEKKESLEKRGVASPDRLDALSMTYFPFLHEGTMQEGESLENYID